MTILQHQSLIAQLSQLDRHVDSLKFFSTPTPSFPSSSSTLLAVGSSRLTGQVWDGSLDIFDVSPVVRKREEKKERLEDCFASPLGSVQIPCGISSISWFPSSSSSSPPSLLTSGDDGVVRMWYLEKLETLEARAEGREGESEGDGDGRILIEVRHFNEHDDLVIGVEANPLEHSSPRFLTASWDSTVKIWDASEEYSTETIECSSPLQVASWSSHDVNLFAAATKDKALRLFDVRTPTTAVRGVIFTHTISALSWKQQTDPHQLAVGTGAGVEILDCRTMTKITERKNPNTSGPVTSLSFVHQGDVEHLLVATPQSASLFSTEGTILASYQSADRGVIRTVAWDGQNSVAIGGNKSVALSRLP